MSIEWKLPTPDEPGFLKRRLEITELLDLSPTPENQEKLIDYLVPFVETKKGISRKDQLLNISKTEYAHAISVLLGYANTIEPKKGEKSVQP